MYRCSHNEDFSIGLQSCLEYCNFMNLKSLYQQHLQRVQQTYSEAAAVANLDTIIIHSGSVEYEFLDDKNKTFRANPHFLYYLPVADAPDSFISIQPNHKPRLFYLQPADYWHVPPPTPDELWADEFEITIVKTLDEVVTQLKQLSGTSAYIGSNPSLSDALGTSQTNPEALLNSIHFARSYKSDYEIECARRATKIAASGHAAAKKAFLNGASEYQIFHQYLQATAQTEIACPYHCIVCLNEHTAVLHYQKYSRTAPEKPCNFLIDAGAIFNGYASDITRTYSLEKNEFSELIAAMNDAQQSICAAVKPGVDFVDLNQQAHFFVASILHQFDLIKLAAEDIITAGLTRYFFPHGLGHYLGIQVHDVAGFQHDSKGKHVPAPQDTPALRLTRSLEAKQVLTIEPGLYFIPQLLKELKAVPEQKYINWEKIERFVLFGGIRIEDNLVVTENSNRNLTREFLA